MYQEEKKKIINPSLQGIELAYELKIRPDELFAFCIVNNIEVHLYDRMEEHDVEFIRNNYGKL